MTQLHCTAALLTCLSLGLTQAQEGLPLPEPVDLERQLTSESHRAYRARSFARRVLLTERAVAAGAGRLTADALSLEDPRRRTALEQVFRVAAKLSAEEFAPAFTDRGKPRPFQSHLYDAALNAPGKVAYASLGHALRHVDPGAPFVPSEALEQANRVLDRVTIDDMARLVARDLRGSVPELRALELPSGAHLRETIDRVTPTSDYFKAQVQHLPTQAPGASGLSDAELRVLTTGIRMANATWISARIQRAAWERSLEKITPAPGNPFGSFDGLKARLFDTTYAERVVALRSAGADARAARQQATHEAFARLVFEYWKDVIELQNGRRAYAQEGAKLEPRIQRQLDSLREATRLLTFSHDQLRRQAFDFGKLQPGMSRADMIAALSGLPAETVRSEPRPSRPAPSGSARPVEPGRAPSRAAGAGFEQVFERAGLTPPGGRRTRAR